MVATVRGLAACLVLSIAHWSNKAAATNDTSTTNSTVETNGNGNGNDDVYDYIVVGSGPGGAPVAVNLAKAGYSVLLLEAGDDQSGDIRTSVLQIGQPQPTNRWDFYVRMYDDDTQQLRNNHLTWKLADGSLWVGNGSTAPADATLLGVYYPRGGTLGGSSVINQGVAVLPPRSEWDHIASLTGDQSWSADNMRQIFQQIENNHYVAPGTAGHGFSGYLDTIANTNETLWNSNPEMLTTFGAMAAAVGDDPADASSQLLRDLNSASPARDSTQGLFALPFHANETWARFSARTLILDTLKAKKPNGSAKYPLTLKTHSLATRVLFEQKPGKKPEATGVAYLEGQSLYSADPRHASSSSGSGTPRTARARREVILSAGVFNTPQLLMLSGVGPQQHLADLDIPLVANLPGVGKHLQDNPEMPIVGLAQQPFTSLPLPGDPVCNFGFPPDPCLDLWTQQGLGPYARPAINSQAFLLRTAHAPDNDTDMLLFGLPNFAFRGYWPAEAAVSIPFDPPGTFGLSMVKMTPVGRAGTVRLRSADPQDTPAINIGAFPGGSSDADLAAMADVVSWARDMFATVPAPLGPIAPTEPPCSSGTSCTASDKQWIRDQTFGHHAVGTCAIGPASDADAVLDSRFRVRGVSSLRVVDGSAFPRSPGAFPVIATFLLGEKASADILDG